MSLYRFLQQSQESFNYFDTFLDLDHLRASFPNVNVVVKTDARPPFALTWSDVDGVKSVEVSSVPMPSPGPYKEDTIPMNSVRFTPTQVDAIRSGVGQVMFES